MTPFPPRNVPDLQRERRFITGREFDPTPTTPFRGHKVPVLLTADEITAVVEVLEGGWTEHTADLQAGLGGLRSVLTDLLDGEEDK